MAELSEEQEAEFKKQHGDIAVVATKYGVLVFKSPSLDAHERWQEKFADGKSSKSSATREYVLSALVQPARDEAAAIFEKMAALPPKVANKLAEMIGADIEIEVKKA
jgi:hypothetical protein